MENGMKTPRKIVWGVLSEDPLPDGSFEIDNTRLEEAAIADKLAVLEALDSMMVSIYKRAKREAASYYANYSQWQKTDYSTTLRPRIRLRPDCGVELSWVKLGIEEKPATPADIEHYGNSKKFTSQEGQGKRIVYHKHEPYLQTIHFRHIRKGAGDSYPAGLFKHNQPSWVQIMGTRLEECLTVLRKQAEEIREIRRKLLTRMHNLDTKYFDISRLSERERLDLGKPSDYRNTEDNAQENDNE